MVRFLKSKRISIDNETQSAYYPHTCPGDARRRSSNYSTSLRETRLGLENHHGWSFRDEDKIKIQATKACIRNPVYASTCQVDRLKSFHLGLKNQGWKVVSDPNHHGYHMVTIFETMLRPNRLLPLHARRPY